MRHRTFLRLVIAIVIGLAGFLVFRYIADERYLIQEDNSPVQVALSWEGRPGLGQTLTLTAHVTSRLPADHIDIKWLVPAGATLAGGPARETLGPIGEGQTLISRRQVTLEQAGEFRLAVGVQLEYGAAATFVGTDQLYLNVAGGRGSSISRNGPRLTSTMDLLNAPNVTISGDPSPDGGFYVRGRVEYIDYTMSPTEPFTTQTMLPAREVEVHIWEEDPVWDDHEGVAITDDDGRFEFRVRNNDDGFLGGDKEIYLIVLPKNSAAWITDRSYIDELYGSKTGTIQGGRDINFGPMSPERWSPMFNLVDAALTVRRYVIVLGGENPTAVHIQYEPGYGEETSHYDPLFGEIAMADNDDDGYDDAVLMHEYTHFLTDNYSCDESPGGEHSASAVQNSKLSWSEGFANFLSSAARGSSWYLDYQWASHQLGAYNWETWGDDPAHPVPTGQDVEGNIVAILWDIYDMEAEPHDRIRMSAEEIWHVVESRMDDKDADNGANACNLYGFYTEWVDVAPDSDSASIFWRYGVNYARDAIAAAEPAGPPAALAGGGAPDEFFVDEVPWRRLIMLVDSTQSMDNEIAAVKDIVQDRVSELDAEPTACQYTVETFADSWNNTPVVDDFFPDVVNAAVEGITVGGGGDREEGSLHAMLEATRNRKGSNVWLFTDGAAKELGFGKEAGVTSNSDANGWVNELARRLRARAVTPYMFIFGQCDDENNPPKDGSTAQIDLQTCIEPYLRTAAATGGQFLFLDTSQVADATEVVRTLMLDNAVSGHFAHTVHDTLWTYEWDDVAYDWFDTTISGTHRLVGETPVNVILPMSFHFYGVERAAYYLTRPGYITFAVVSTVSTNTPIPNPALPNNAIYAFWDNIDNAPTGRQPQPDADMGVYTYWGGMSGDPNRYYIEYHKNVQYATGLPVTFQIILQRDPEGAGMDEIIVQYQEVGDDSSVTVGTENSDGTLATQFVANMADYLYPGRALKFTPIPPGPRDHLVPVDEYMESASFFMNGYQGSVDLALFRPDGTPVSTSDPDVTYYSIGMVEFFKIASPAAGTWRARVSGSGTYYFTSSAVTDWKMKSLSERTLSMDETTLVMDLGLTTTVPTTFTLVNERGVAAAQLALLDDGDHGDGEAGDGVYGGLYQPTAPGTLYLQVEGLTPAGYPFRRLDPVPFTFQPMDLSGSTTVRFLRPGDSRVTFFRLDNDDVFTRTYDLFFESTQGWVTPAYLTVTVPAGEMRLLSVSYHVPINAGNVVDELTMTAVSHGVADAASYTTVVRRPTDFIDLLARPMTVAPNGQQAVVQVFLVDSLEYNVADGTRVTFATTLGTIAPTSTTTLSGEVRVTLTTGIEVGLARIVAAADGVTAAITLVVEVAPAQTLTLEVADDVLPPDGASTTTVTAHVYDRDGNPAPDGSVVVFAVGGDDLAWGSLLGQEVYTTTTGGGVATATYQSGIRAGEVTLWAKLAGDSPPGEGDITLGPSASILLRLSYGLGYEVYLPVVFR